MILNYFYLLLALISCGLSLCACGDGKLAAEPSKSGGAPPKKHQPPSGPPPVQAEARKVQMRDFKLTVAVTGAILPYREAQVAASVEGLVTAVHIDEGQEVKEGKVLVTLENDIWKARIKEKQAEYRKLQAEYARLQSGYLKEEIKQRQEAVREIKANLNNLSSELKRKQELFLQKNISETEWDQARFTYEAAQARLQKALAELQLYQRGYREELIAAAKADLEKTAAQLEQLQISFDKTTITAPFSGAILEKKVEVGQWVAVGSSVVTLLDLTQIKVGTYVAEKYIRLVQMGMQAEITLEALPGKKFVGKVIEILPQASALDRNFPVRLLLKQPDPQIRAGMFCRISAVLRHNPKALMVHSDAILRQRQQDTVIKITAEHTAEFIPVTLGGRDGEWFEVLSASDKLQAGNRVVITNNPSIFPGARLIIIREY